MSFTEKYSQPKQSGNISQRIFAKTALMYDLRFPEGDTTAFFIIKVNPAKQSVFLRLIKSGAPINLIHYGNILYSGYGEPSDALKNKLRDEYGMYKIKKET